MVDDWISFVEYQVRVVFLTKWLIHAGEKKK